MGALLALLLGPVLGPVKAVFGWLVRHPLELIIVVLMAAAAFLQLRDANLTKELAAAKQQQAKATQTISTLRTGIKEQNAGVERLLQQGVANEQASQQLAQQREQAAEKVRVVYQTRVERIEAAPVPGTCASAAEWAAEQAQSLAAGWSK